MLHAEYNIEVLRVEKQSSPYTVQALSAGRQLIDLSLRKQNEATEIMHGFPLWLWMFLEYTDSLIHSVHGGIESYISECNESAEILKI